MPAHIEWTRERLDEVQETIENCARTGGIIGAVERAASAHGVTRGAIKHAFRAHGRRPPSHYAREACSVFGDELNTSLPPRDPEHALSHCTPTLAQLQDWIQQTADETHTEPYNVTRRSVLAHTPAKSAHFIAYGGFPKVRRDGFGPGDDEQPDLADRQGLRRNANKIAALERQLGDREYLGRHLESAITRAFELCPIQLSTCYQPRIRTGPTPRLLTALLSDLHLGLSVDPREVPGAGFNWEIAARRIGKVCAQLADWKPNRRDETRLQLVLAGDLIHGLIHADDAGMVRLTEQIHGTAQILIPAFDFLLRHFGAISVLCLPGNHERVTKERQLAQRWDHYGHAVYLALQAAFRRQTDHVRFDVPRSGDGTFKLPGGEFAFANHGDVMPATGNPGASIQTGKVIAAFNALNASGVHPAPVRLWLAGHYHTPFVLHVSTGSIVINGSLIGADCYSRNAVNEQAGGCPGQYLIESIPGYPMGDARLITLRDADDNSAYSDIIPTPSLELNEVPA